MQIKLRLELDDKVLELTEDEARELYTKLDALFGNNTVYIPYTVPDTDTYTVPDTDIWQYPYYQTKKWTSEGTGDVQITFV
jgi:hypothetical protein